MGGSKHILETEDRYSSLLLRSISLAALFIPIVIVAYGLLAHFNIVERSTSYTSSINLIVSISLVVMAFAQYRMRTISDDVVFGFVAIYHVLAAMYLIFISGFMNPPTVFWLPLMVISDLYYGKKGLIYSGLLLMSVAIISLPMQTVLDVATLSNQLSYGVSIFAISLFVSLFKDVYTAEHSDLMRSKKVEGKAQGQIETLINSINESIVSINALGIVQTYNAATLNLLDTNQSLAGKHINDILHLYDQSGQPIKLFELLKNSMTSSQWDEYDHRYTDGEDIRLGITTSIVRNNSPQTKNLIEGYIVLIRDITKSKSLEEERDEFISVISHELRTPITIAEGALSNVQLLMERGADTAKLSSMLENAHDQVLFLAKMVNDLSTLSRAERGVADTAELIDVSSLIHDLYNQYQSKATEKGLVLNLDIHGKVGFVKASPLYLEEILQNFITNAIKYTVTGSVTIHVSIAKHSVSFSVQDTGIGISKSDQKKVFEKFYRSEDYRTRETSGTGLGLYVVRKLSHKLGTTVELTSRLNHGSTFGFSLPSAAAPLDVTTR